MEILFWILIALVFYTYLGYGLLLYLLIRLKRYFKGKPQVPDYFYPEVSLVIPAYNEEDFIAEKAANSLALSYPKDKLTILFITDGSTDRTVEILKEIDGVQISHSEGRAGKAAAENRAMTLVQSPFVVFCDANTYLNTDCIEKLVRHYQDPQVGAVSGEKRVQSLDSEGASAAGEGLYWRYESTLKRWDSELYTVVGAAGELISFRSNLVEHLEEDTILDDFMQTLRVCKKGYRVVYEPDAYASETASENVGEELKRKVRIAAGGWQSMARLKSLLWPSQPLLTFQYISHRVLRWSLSAFALPLIFALNVYLLEEALLYRFLWYAQWVFYALALVGWILENQKLRVKVLFVPYYFTMMNYAVFAGFYRWLKGGQKATWERARRAQA